MPTRSSHCVDQLYLQPDENLRSDFRRSEKNQREEKKNLSQTLTPLSLLSVFFLFILLFYFIILFLLLLLLLLLLFWIHDLYCFIRVCFYPKTIYFFSVHFILNELSPNHFLTSEIFVKISSLKSLTAYHPENRKIFRLSQNSMKLLWVTRFRETNLTA